LKPVGGAPRTRGLTQCARCTSTTPWKKLQLPDVRRAVAIASAGPGGRARERRVPLRPIPRGRRGSVRAALHLEQWRESKGFDYAAAAAAAATTSGGAVDRKGKGWLGYPRVRVVLVHAKSSRGRWASGATGVLAMDGWPDGPGRSETTIFELGIHPNSPTSTSPFGPGTNSTVWANGPRGTTGLLHAPPCCIDSGPNEKQ